MRWVACERDNLLAYEVYVHIPAPFSDLVARGFKEGDRLAICHGLPSDRIPSYHQEEVENQHRLGRCCARARQQRNVIYAQAIRAKKSRVCARRCARSKGGIKSQHCPSGFPDGLESTPPSFGRWEISKVPILAVDTYFPSGPRHDAYILAVYSLKTVKR